MRVSLLALQVRVTRLAERVERRAADTVDLEARFAVLDEGRRRNAAGIRLPRMTEEQFAVWAAELRASVHQRDGVLAERLIAGRQRAMAWRKQ